MSAHPTLGQEPQRSDDPQVCSLCPAEIPDEHAPLIIWSACGKRAWTYCKSCEARVLPTLVLAEGAM
ncbi:MAG: hypothetical protein P4L73_03530 [Caulobacteraceae bacterium]|nr:hypothetical protein [Caulobacteraceae bacterium]